MSVISNNIKYLIESLTDNSDDSVYLKHLQMALFLSEWKHALDNQFKTVNSNIWCKQGDQPYLDSLVDNIEALQGEVEIVRKKDSPDYWMIKNGKKTKVDSSLLADSFVKAIQKVSDDYNKMGSSVFEELVRSTYPMVAWLPTEKINISELSKEYVENVRPFLKTAA